MWSKVSYSEGVKENMAKYVTFITSLGMFSRLLFVWEK